MKERESALNKADEIAEFYNKYYDTVYKYVYREIPNRQVAEDIAQDTFLIALEKKEEFLVHPAPMLWLLRTARNKMLELYRRMRYWEFEPLVEKGELAREDPLYEYKEIHLSALAILDEEEWMLFKRRYMYDDTVSELAEELGITDNNMRVRFSRIRKKLQKGLQ